MKFSEQYQKINEEYARLEDPDEIKNLSTVANSLMRIATNIKDITITLQNQNDFPVGSFKSIISDLTPQAQKLVEILKKVEHFK